MDGGNIIEQGDSVYLSDEYRRRVHITAGYWLPDNVGTVRIVIEGRVSIEFPNDLGEPHGVKVIPVCGVPVEHVRKYRWQEHGEAED